MDSDFIISNLYLSVFTDPGHKLRDWIPNNKNGDLINLSKWPLYNPLIYRVQSWLIDNLIII